MKKYLLLVISTVFTFGKSYAQVGINANTPNATLDVFSKGNTSSTKALKISNSTATELVTVANNGNVGINNPTPEASALLELKSSNKALLITKVANTSAIANPVNGMILYDNSSNCIKAYENNSWTDCLSKNIASASGNCSNQSFSGNFLNGVALSGAKYTITVTNNATSTSSNTFSTSDLALSGINGISVASVSPSSLSLNSGQSQTVEYTLSGTPTSSGTLTGTWSNLSLNCTKTTAVTNIDIASLNCSGATNIGFPMINTSVSGVTSRIPYTGGNGAAYSSQSISSTGVLGLTATLNAGNFAVGNGTLTYTITGTPTSKGTASFAINIGGKSCTLAVTVYPASTYLGTCPNTAVAYRGNNNTVYSCDTTSTQWATGNIWGTGTYTDDSNIARAAVHSGIIPANTATRIHFRIVPGQSSYTSSTQNGITSTFYPSWTGSFDFNY